jgi:hypothetical protein
MKEGRKNSLLTIFLRDRTFLDKLPLGFLIFRNGSTVAGFKRTGEVGGTHKYRGSLAYESKRLCISWSYLSSLSDKLSEVSPSSLDIGNKIGNQ